MTKKKTIRKKNLIDFAKVEQWTDEEVLTNMSTLLQRANVSTEFMTEDMEGQEIITGQVMMIVSGDKAVFSEPRVLDWPLQRMPVPKALKPVLN